MLRFARVLARAVQWAVAAGACEGRRELLTKDAVVVKTFLGLQVGLQCEADGGRLHAEPAWSCARE
eukprot:1807932-Alexandrium_andersonii.AAC.1